MNSYRDHLWFLLDEWIQYMENTCDSYSTQLVFKKENLEIRQNFQIFRNCIFMAITHYIVMLSVSFLYPHKSFFSICKNLRYCLSNTPSFRN